jgi:hypothetical protein
MNTKVIKLSCFGMVIELGERDAERPELHLGGSITSDLKESCEHCNNPLCDFDCEEALNWAQNEDYDIMAQKNEELREKANYNHMMDAIEDMVLAHACAGIDIESPAYIEGIETAVQGCADNVRG